MSAPIKVPGIEFLDPEGNGVRILSLDGGDARCFSQLSILAELMHRLEYDYGRPVRPCEFFHSITGVGASGVIAILLGILGMTVEEASTAFIGICERVFAANVCNETCRSEILMTELERILESLNLRANSLLAGNLARNAGCLVSICYSAAATHGCRMFRNYGSTQYSYNPTIVEAARSSWATPGLFSSIYVGPPLFAEELISAVNGFNNPTLQAVQEVRELYGADRAVSTFLSLGSGKRGAVSVHSGDSLRRTAQQTDVTEEDVERELGLSGVYYRFSPGYTIEGDTFGVERNQFGSIMSYTRAYLESVKTRRTMESYLKASACTSSIDLNFNAQAQNLATHLHQLPQNLQLSPEENTLLERLSIQGLDCDSPLQGCMKGTRESILQRVNDWTTNLAAPNILWLKGHPGVGKSAIATEVVEQLAAVGRLGSSFFFQRQKDAILTPQALWRTVAYDLAQKHPTIRRTVMAKLKMPEVRPTTANVDNLFRHFIQDPLLASGGIPNGRLPVVVIDALDECGGLEGPNSEHRKSLLKTLRDWSNLTTKFKLIVTSRGEHDLNHIFSEIGHNLIHISAGRRVDAQSSEDIRVFLTKKLYEITPRYSSLPRDWPGAESINKLVHTAGGLFIWAQTAVKFIQSGQPRVRLEDVLKVGVSGDIDELYETILRTSFHGRKAEALNEYSHFRSVVGAIILAKDPLSVSSISALLSLSTTSVEHVCTGLQSVLECQNTLRFNHQTFVDFLLNSETCPRDFFIDPKSESRKLTLACLRVMKDKLCFNICGIESSYLRNSDILDLQTRIGKSIQSHLFYSSYWWASHLAETGFDEEIFGHLQCFMREQFLYWLELMSVTKGVNQGSQMLKSLTDWISCYHQNDACAMSKDLQAFVDTFAPAISQSAPHIYLSALPFAPSSSAISKQHIPHYPQTLQIKTGGLTTWPATQNVLTGHSSVVCSVAFSPDGRRVASGSADGTVRIWDAATGEMIVVPLEGRNDWVWSVAFSPDGRRVVSSSSDKTIRIWDAATGEMVVGPLEGHNGRVGSVAFSPDGRRVVSGSSDETIRIWDAETGDMVVGPLEGHIGRVSSVAFSQDGRYVVSGSADRTVRIWDAKTGGMVVGPLEGHSVQVTSVAFSPDGKYVVSGSSDHTIRVWDAETGGMVIGPLEGHSNPVNSVAFSPDGGRVVSGSDDHTIRIWDAKTGETVIVPFEGHDSEVNSVAFSPDGRSVVSGSSDMTIQIWDAVAGETVVGPHEGHSSGVNSVTFSPDGRRVVSGSHDGTTRIWDVTTGEMVVGPLEGCGMPVNSVAFSPDGRHVVSSSDETIQIRNTMTGETVMGPLKGHNGFAWSVAFSPDGRRVVSGSLDDTIQIWDSATGEMVLGPLEGHSNPVNSVAFSPDGRCIVSGSSDHTIRIWDATTGETVVGPFEGHSDEVCSVAFSPDGRRVASGSSDETIRIWDAATGEMIVVPLEGHNGRVWSVAFSPDGRRVVSGSRDRTIRIWDVATGEMVGGPFEGHTYWVQSVAFSPDGRCVVSGSSDKTIRIWDVATGGMVVGPLERHSDGVTSVLLSADRRCVVSGTGDTTTGGWNTGFYGLKDQSYSFFNDSSPMEDGWLLGRRSELILWVPPPLRVGLWRPSNKLVIGKCLQTRLNFDSFVHGTSWALCKTSPHPVHARMPDRESLATLKSSTEPAEGSNSMQLVSNTGPGRPKRKASENLTEATDVGRVIGKKARSD